MNWSVQSCMCVVGVSEQTTQIKGSALIGMCVVTGRHAPTYTHQACQVHHLSMSEIPSMTKVAKKMSLESRYILYTLTTVTVISYTAVHYSTLTPPVGGEDRVREGVLTMGNDSIH